MKDKKYIIDLPQPYAWLVAMGYRKLPVDLKSPPKIGEKVYLRGKGFLSARDTRIVIEKLPFCDFESSYKLDVAAAITGKIIGECLVVELFLNRSFWDNIKGLPFKNMGAARVAGCRVINPRYTPGSPGTIRQIYPPKRTDNDWTWR